mgnify:CR=1 FL=1
MKINIYYGGRGVLDDPTIYVLKKMEAVLKELRVEVKTYNLYEYKNEITTLPETLKEPDGIILATTVEWMGIGGYMTQFLDACWLYGDKSRISEIYMQPVVISKTYGEREGMMTLENAWEILGGNITGGLCGYVEDRSEFESDQEYRQIIEKKAENLYRTISQRATSLPASNQAITRTIMRSETMELTPQESEQLSRYVADDTYVAQQKQDVLELSSIYRNMLGSSPDDSDDYIESFKSHFVPQEGMRVSYQFVIDGMAKPLYLGIYGDELICHYGEGSDVDVEIRLAPEVLDGIVAGRSTFQKAFTMGELSAKGPMRVIYMLDEAIPFMD